MKKGYVVGREREREKERERARGRSHRLGCVRLAELAIERRECD